MDADPDLVLKVHSLLAESNPAVLGCAAQLGDEHVIREYLKNFPNEVYNCTMGMKGVEFKFGTLGAQRHRSTMSCIKFKFGDFQNKLPNQKPLQSFWYSISTLSFNGNKFKIWLIPVLPHCHSMVINSNG